MKLITAIIRPEKLNEVLAALYEVDVKGLTLTRCMGHGGELETVETYRGTTVKMGLVEKMRIEIGVSDHFLDAALRACMNSARTGEVGDGKIFVTDLEKVVRIRTGEEDEAAVTPQKEVEAHAGAA